MKLLKWLNLKIKSLNENRNVEYKWTRIEIWYISAGILERVSKEQKWVNLLDDFNVNLLNYNDEFLDSLASSSYIPYILQPTRITDHSETLIGNIFSNVISADTISGNLTATISDHLPQSMIVPNVFSNLPSSISSVYEETGQILIKSNLYLATLLLIGNWDDALNINEEKIQRKPFLIKLAN